MWPTNFTSVASPKVDKGPNDPFLVWFPDLPRLSKIAFGTLKCLAAAFTPIVPELIAVMALFRSFPDHEALSALGFRLYLVGILKKQNYTSSCVCGPSIPNFGDR